MININDFKNISFNIGGIVAGLVGSLLFFGTFLTYVYDELTFNQRLYPRFEVVERNEISRDSLVIEFKSGRNFYIESDTTTTKKLKELRVGEKIVLILSWGNVYIVKDKYNKIIYKNDLIRSSHVQSIIILFFLTIIFIFILIKSISLLRKNNTHFRLGL